LGVGLIFSLSAPSTAFVFVPLSFLTTLILVSSDLTNKSFIQKVLAPKPYSNLSLPQTIDSQLQLLTKSLKTVSHPEVRIDLEKVIKQLNKTKKLIQSVSLEDSASMSFIQDFLPQIIEKTVKLSKQEQVARDYLEENTQDRIQLEIDALEKNKQNSKDKISIAEYDKALVLKKEQFSLIQKMKLKLERINSYLINILAGLEQTNTYITKVKLKDDNYGFVDQSQYLTESLKQITTDLDDLNN
jgi:hypothetical protein